MSRQDILSAPLLCVLQKAGSRRLDEVCVGRVEAMGTDVAGDLPAMICAMHYQMHEYVFISAGPALALGIRVGNLGTQEVIPRHR